MSRPFLSGLRARLLLLVFAAVLPAFALSFYMGWEDRQRQRADVAGDTVALARILANDQERAIENTRQILSDLAGVPEVRAGDPVRSRRFFALLMKQYHGYASFSVLAPDGRVLVSEPAVDHPVALADRPWFQRALATRDFVVGEYQLGRLTGKSVLVAAWPIVDDTGRVVSVLSSALDVSWLNQIAATAQLPRGAVLVLVDRHGVVVARYPETAGRLGSGLADAELGESLRRQSEGVVDVRGEDGVGRVYAFTRVRVSVDSGLRLAVGIPRSVAYGFVRRLQRRNLVALLTVMVFTLAAAWFGARRFVLRGVDALLAATRRLSAGDQTARTNLPYDAGELGDLARSFDEMAGALQARGVERDRTGQALQESEERFRTFMDNSPALAFVRNEAGGFTYANATMERYFGLRAGAWRDLAGTDLWSAESAETFRRDDTGVVATGEPRQTVGPVTLRDGRQRHWLTVKFPVCDHQGRRSVATLSLDMTEWRDAQDELARAERRYTELVEQASDGIIMADEQLRLVAANSAACAMSGYAADELLGLRADELLCADDLEARGGAPAGRVPGQRMVSERRLRRKDGTVVPVEISSWVVENGWIQAIVRDVGQRLAAEWALRESEERFRLLYQYLPLAYQSVAEDGTLVLVNDAWSALTGMDRAQAVGRRFADLLAPDSVEVFAAALANATASGDVHDAEVTLVRADGAPVTVSLDARRGRDERGRVRVHCALHDVTASREAEARVRESEERYRTLFAESPISLLEEDFSGIRRYVERLRALGVTDLDEHLTANPDELDDCVEAVRVVDVNRATLALYGAEDRSQLLAGLDRIFGHDGREPFRRSIVALANGERSWTSEGVNYALNGDPIRLALQWSLAPGAEETWSRVLVSAMDITSRTRMEDALRDSEARFERVFRSAPEIIGITRRSDGTYLDVNDEFLARLGYRRDEVIGRSGEQLGLWVTPAGRTDVLRALDAGETVRNRSVQVRRKTGGVLDGMLSVVPLRVLGEDCLLSQMVDTTALLRAEETGRETQRMLATLMSNLAGVVYQCCPDPESTMLFVSEGCSELTGYEPADLIGNRRVSYGSLILDEDRDAVRAEVGKAMAEDRPFRLTYRLRHADGSVRWVWEQGRAVQVAAGEPLTLEGFITDITDRRKAEEELQQSTEQLRQAQKMEAVGRLAGGIAHDFNNLLTAILGYSDLVLGRLAPDDPLCARVEEIRKAGQSAASLTRKLLAFSRKQVAAESVIDLNGLLGEMAPMLRRVIGEDIELRVEPGHSGSILADPTHIEQVLMNLVANARDAMPRGGLLAIRTGSMELDGTSAPPASGAAPGAYVTLTVSDSGVGMDEETHRHLFEPFFTTKAPGHGTGLGLATVYGIVQQSGGFITVESAVGHGTTFVVALPRVEPSLVQPPTGHRLVQAMTGTETILVAEDEEAVRRLIRAILERHGYTVLEAADGQQALHVWQEQQDRIDLVVTDVVMPHVNGPTLVGRMRTSKPRARVVYLSGYTDDTAVRRADLAPGTPFLQKPFTASALARTVRAALDAQAPAEI